MKEILITSSVLIAVLLLLRRVLRGKISLRLQYGLWLLVAARLLAPVPLFSSPVSVLNAVEAAGDSAPVQAVRSVGRLSLPARSFDSAYAQVVEEYKARGVDVGALEGSALEELDYEAYDRTRGPTLAEAARAVWIAGMGGMGVWFLAANLTFRRKLRRTAAAVDVPGCPVPVYISPAIPSPCLAGLFRQAVYLTPGLEADEARLRHILTHELTHRRHGDPFWSLVRCLCLTIYWFNPLVWVAAAISRRDCELACDEGVLSRLGEDERAAYGRTLLSLVALRTSPADLLRPATTMTSGKGGLRERITLIARRPKMMAVTLAAVVVIAAVAVGCTFTAAQPGDSGDSEPVPLTEEELAYFNGDDFFNGEYLNLPNQFLSSLYAAPEDIDLFQLFYCGAGDGLPEGVDPSALNAAMEAAVTEAEGGVPDCPATVLTTAAMDAVLTEYLGLTLAETNRVGLDQFTYLPEYDVYFHYHGDTNYRSGVTFSSGTRRGALVELVYEDTFMADGWKVLTLWETEGGWQFVSHTGGASSGAAQDPSSALADALADLPEDLRDRIVVGESGDLPGEGTGLASYYYAPDYGTDWGGRICEVARVTPVQFEQNFASWELTGGTFYLGRDADWYYVYHSPTDVSFDPEHYEDYRAAADALSGWLSQVFAAQEGMLTDLREDPFYASKVLWYSDGRPHVCVRFYPYYGLSDYEDQADAVYTLVLSQPVRQGEGGIWCVDRWYDAGGNLHYAVPNADATSASVYATRQEASDQGYASSYLDPVQTAVLYMKEETGRLDLSPDAFTQPEPYPPSDVGGTGTDNWVSTHMAAIVGGTADRVTLTLETGGEARSFTVLSRQGNGANFSDLTYNHTWTALSGPDAAPPPQPAYTLTVANEAGTAWFRFWADSGVVLYHDPTEEVWLRAEMIQEDPWTLSDTMRRWFDETEFQANLDRYAVVTTDSRDFDAVARLWGEALGDAMRRASPGSEYEVRDARPYRTEVYDTVEGDDTQFRFYLDMALDPVDPEGPGFMSGAGLEPIAEGEYAGYWKWYHQVVLRREGDTWRLSGWGTG